MKSLNEIKHIIKELNLNAENMEYWDGEPDMYINKGWIEALEWVIGLQLKRTKYPRGD